MSERVGVKDEFAASDTNSGGSTSAPEFGSKELTKIDPTAGSDAVPAKKVTQIDSAANTESTIESQDESLMTEPEPEPGAAEESGPHKSRRRVKGVLKRLQDQV